MWILQIGYWINSLLAKKEKILKMVNRRVIKGRKNFTFLFLRGIVVIGYLLKFAKLVRNWYVDFFKKLRKDENRCYMTSSRAECGIRMTGEMPVIFIFEIKCKYVPQILKKSKIVA